MPLEELQSKRKDGTIRMIPVGRSLTDEEVKGLGITKDMRPHGTGIGTVHPDDAAYYSESSSESALLSAGGSTPQPAPQAAVEAVDAAELDLQELIGGSPTQAPERRIVEVNGQPVAFYIKHLSLKERTALEGKKYRRVGGQVEMLSPDVMDTVTTAWLLHDCVVRADGSPHWTIEELLGRAAVTKGKDATPRVVGLLEMNSPHIEQMIYDLREHIYSVNVRLNPMFMAREMGLIGAPSKNESDDG